MARALRAARVRGGGEGLETRGLIPPARRWVFLALAALLASGVGLRLWKLDEGPLFIDEAESCLNGLTILEHGVPADHYLGLPLFENTLTEPWPESAEYEFRDTSYSSRGVAVYHGWLPLYAIAASQALLGIWPDRPTNPPRALHGQEEMRARIRAGRLPGVFFGVLFLLGMFWAGRALFGVDAGLVALLIAALAPKCIWLAQQARYYSAGLAFSALLVGSLWRMATRGTWRDFVSGALLTVALFHTNCLALVAILTPALGLLPRLVRVERAAAKGALAALLVVAGVVPWMLATGYLEHLGGIPMARDLLRFPQDYWVYLAERRGRVLAGAALFALFGLLWCSRARLAARFARPLEAAGAPALFLVGSTIAAYFGFQALVPAASCSMARLSHQLIVAPILLASIALASSLRGFFPGRAEVASLPVALLLLLIEGSVLHRQERNPFERVAAEELVEHLSRQDFASDTRIFALPYQHFPLTYYTGLPIQSIAPVRREFLASYPGAVWILETASRWPCPAPETVQCVAEAAGIELSLEEARAHGPGLQAELIRSEVGPLVRSLAPEPQVRPAWYRDVLEGLPAALVSSGQGRIDYARDNPAMFTGVSPLSHAEFWPAFFYRFVVPGARSGSNLNYAPRIREADAYPLASGWIVYRCPARQATPDQ